MKTTTTITTATTTTTNETSVTEGGLIAPHHLFVIIPRFESPDIVPWIPWMKDGSQPQVVIFWSNRIWSSRK